MRLLRLARAASGPAEEVLAVARMALLGRDAFRDREDLAGVGWDRMVSVMGLTNMP